MKKSGKLSAQKIRTLAKKGTYADGDGLFLQVRSATARSWVLRYWPRGSTSAKEMGLGPLSAVPLSEARDRATEIKAKIIAGEDPIAARDAQLARETAEAVAKVEAALTFEAATEGYIETHKAEWSSDEHARIWKASIANYAYPRLRTKDVGEIDQADILAILEPMWAKKNVTARRLRGRIENILNWAKVKGHRAGENPANWRGNLEHLLARKNSRKNPVKHFAYLPYEKLPALMADLRATPGHAYRALEFCILTAARTSNVLGAKWDEIDLDKAIWSIPAEKMKMPKDHEVPLSPRAVAILRIQERALEEENTKRAEEGLRPLPGGYVFLGRKKGKQFANAAMITACDDLGWYDGITIHGFRSTFSTWANECTQHKRDIIDVSLAHKNPDEVEASYNHATYVKWRTELMADWATYCETDPKQAVAQAA